MPRVGDVGTIRRICVSCPDDGDETFLVLDVKWEYGQRMIVGEDEVTLATETDAWLRRQLDGLTPPRQEG